MTERGAPASRKPEARTYLDWKAWVGVLLSLALLYWAFRDVDLGEVLARIRRADFGPLLAAVAAVTAVFPLRAARWRPLLQPVHPTTRFHPRFAATCVGFMANNLLPARIGEFVRAYALTRLEPVRMSASFGSLVVERILDGTVLMALLLGALAWPTFPEVGGRGFGRAAVIAALAFVLLFTILLALVIRPERSVRLFERLARRLLPRSFQRPVVEALEAFLKGVAAIRNVRLVLEAMTWTVLIWFVNALGFWVAFQAFGIELPFLAAVFLQSLIALAAALPSAPGFFGPFEAAARVGLVEVWGVGSSTALAFALGLHLGGFIPITVIGLVYVWRLGMTWQEVGHSEEALEADGALDMDS